MSPWVLYILLFLAPLCFLIPSAYLVQYRRRKRHPYPYLPPEIRDQQRRLLDSRPLPPRKGVFKFVLRLLGRPPTPPPRSYNPTTQSRSTLLLQLPPELRLRIYKEVLGESRIHCVPLLKSVGYFCCSASIDEMCCCDNEIINGRQRFELWWNLKVLPEGVTKPSLEFLRTCRQVYVEASDIFYTTNVFAINSIWTPMDMPNVVPPRRLHQIRKLSLSFNFGRHGIVPLMSPISQNPMHLPATDQTWIKAWKCLSTHFIGVQELKVVLEMRSLDLFIEHRGSTWLQPLLEAAKLPLKRCSVSLQGWDARFCLRKDEIPPLERKLESLLLVPNKPLTSTTIESSE